MLGLAAPTLVATFRHRDVFDFGRWQAVAWVVLFVASVTSFGALALTRGATDPRAPSHAALARLVLEALAAADAAVAGVMWAWPGDVSEQAPVAAAGLLALTMAGLSVLSAGPRVVSPPTRGGAVR